MVQEGDIWAGRLSGGRHVIYRVLVVHGIYATCKAGRRKKNMPTVMVPLRRFAQLELVRRRS